ncbi:hypothetical protein LVY72_11920 [Arthrobacter sp. I2-34]|uniref:Uncharacterized protein n=1 Tax=Arthrobacter hankyongi TaxID=2904801 RepID=A0ABS9L7G6_9MICC|nr:hypothetical protein [Arthrobacter hankyongi]MCG2622616.1 hypothetical protein [Arthrobacter hankyongi]
MTKVVATAEEGVNKKVYLGSHLGIALIAFALTFFWQSRQPHNSRSTKPALVSSPAPITLSPSRNRIKFLRATITVAFTFAFAFVWLFGLAWYPKSATVSMLVGAAACITVAFLLLRYIRRQHPPLLDLPDEKVSFLFGYAGLVITVLAFVFTPLIDAKMAHTPVNEIKSPLESLASIIFTLLAFVAGIFGFHAGIKNK